ncbi:MAG TPA: CerR family C-terminal domain-containing protein [Holophagaceae bacterium]
MTPPPPELPQDTRHRLIEAAILTFAEKGYDGAGIREIAQRAKANSALVTYHFGGKEGLYREALRHISARKASEVAALPPPPQPGSPRAREAALQGMKAYIRAFVTDLMSCPAESEVDAAAMALIGREIQMPHPVSAPVLLEFARPYMERVLALLRVLRPDADPETLLRMTLSIQGQILHFRNSLGFIRLLSGDPDFPKDLEALIQHFTDFSLRGLGVPEAFPQTRP